ncbi:MAG: hypothetical protein JWM59_424 [Verrucomicrobiales bacterium]|nr:hypothetical protein [Verrucomicrobiales bacterium]
MTTVLGIRHHGPGCARSLVRALDFLQPDLVLIEGPPDADEWMHVAGDEKAKPPVALLVYDTANPKQSSFYPFAEFSPEWQAMRWAVKHGVKMRFLDLPCAHRFGLETETELAVAETGAETNTESEPESELGQDDGGGALPPDEAISLDENLPPPPEQAPTPRSFRHDPMQWLARADGYTDSERWWNDRVEERADDTDFFEAILTAMTALRTELALPEADLDLKREAWMRRGIREAEKAGARNIAVVCGAWHAPALLEPVKASEDAALLKGLPKTKVSVTWAPWSMERLTVASGYGAGVESPGWYGHLWKGGADLITRWIIRAARELRKSDVGASTASVIEAVRLSTALAGLRGRPRPGLPETMEAMRAIFCHGDPAPLALLRKKLLVGEKLGKLPDGLPLLPLHADLQQQQKTLRLKQTAGDLNLELDLREPGGQARSVFLHRLEALRIRWGRKTSAGRSKGTFKEQWTLKWLPELSLAIVDASQFGNTVDAAAAGKLAHDAAMEQNLAALVELLETGLLAELPAAGQAIMAQVGTVAAGSGDPAELMAAIPPLVRLARYGNVRNSDLAQVRHIVTGLAARVHAELPPAVSGLNDDAAQTLAERISAHDAALHLLEDGPLLAEWAAVTALLMDHGTAHPRIRGLATRIQRDAGTLNPAACGLRLEFALSPAQEPDKAVAWISGFLTGSGTVLVHDISLLSLLHDWLGGLTEEHFKQVLPLLRRTFGAFQGPERARIGAAVTQLPSGGGSAAARPSSGQEQPAVPLDEARSRPAVETAAQLLGLSAS